MKKRLFPILAAGMAILLTLPAAAADRLPLSVFLKNDTFTAIKISPTGKYLAATVPVEDKTVLVVLDRDTMEQTGLFNLRGRTHVVDFWWVNDERVVMSVGEKRGRLELPRPTGELYATNADGTRQEVLAGFRAGGDTNPVGTRIRGKANENVFAVMVDPLPEDKDNVIVGIYSGGSLADEPVTTAERMDVYSGYRVKITTAPERRSQFLTDHKGQVRFAVGAGADNKSKLYHRADDRSEWKLLNDHARSGFDMYPVGFGEDRRTAYLGAQEIEGPDAIYAYDTVTGEMKKVLQDDNTEPYRILYSLDRQSVIGAAFMDPVLRHEFFDPVQTDSRLYRSLVASFPGESVLIDSATRDGRFALLRVFGAGNPGDYFVFDTGAKKAAHLVSSRAWIDPAAMGEVRPISLKARDGLDLHGYVTLPPGSDGKNLPMVVNPHGGPFAVQDIWAFNDEAQMLASRGYAVLQVNFRGSDGYGLQFETAGYKQWGRTMQDDVTDATRWAIAQGIADKDRVCIYGASYGAYAALMGVAREPDLYRCAVGYIGVYDLRLMHSDGDIPQRLSGRNLLEDILGSEKLDEYSPTRLAARIKSPVFLAAGGEDERAPLKHTRAMESALKAAGGSVETLIYPTEGHGFFNEANREAFYTRLLAFLDRHIGQARSTAAN
ncbi:MAG TPA: S9 family peptidase [Xanthomonadaceae bacterium]|nr:S9 family peptidase [Xanthomonadaceae bacterium]